MGSHVVPPVDKLDATCLITPTFAFVSKGAVALHWPVVNSPHMLEKLGRRELEAKRLEDDARYVPGTFIEHQMCCRFADWQPCDTALSSPWILEVENCYIYSPKYVSCLLLVIINVSFSKVYSLAAAFKYIFCVIPSFPLPSRDPNDF